MEKIIYTKFSNDRSSEYAISTRILLDEEGKKVIEKVPCTKAAKEHVYRMVEIEKQLLQLYEPMGIEINRCECSKEGVRFRYIEGKTLENVMDELLEAGQQEKAKKFLVEYLDMIQSTASEKVFTRTEEFEQFFGTASFQKEMKCAKITDIDLILSNILVNEKYHIIDYEWTFTFPIPIQFVLYRIIQRYDEICEARQVVKEWKLFEWYGIDNEDISQFENMENNFQRSVLKQRHSLDTLYWGMTPGNIQKAELEAFTKQELKKNRMQIFWSAGRKFCEEQSKFYSIKGKKQVEYIFELSGEEQYIRIDPLVSQGEIKNFKVEDEEGNPIPVHTTNGKKTGDAAYIFTKDDPQIVLKKLPKSMKYLKICYEVSEL